MNQDYDIDEQVLYRINEECTQWNRGIITTMFTNRYPIHYIVLADNQNKVCVSSNNLQKFKSIQQPLAHNENVLGQRNQTIKQQLKSDKSEHKLSITNGLIDISFQKILSQLAQQRNEEQMINELYSILKTLTDEQAMELVNGPKVIYAFYTLLNMRKSSILRNHPFSNVVKIIKMLKKLIFQIKRLVLQKYHLHSQHNEQIIEQSIEPIRRKLSQRTQQCSDESEKEEQPTAFLEIKKPNKSSFHLYKPKIAQQNDVTNTSEQGTMQSKLIYFRPVVIQGPQNISIN